MTTSQTVQHGGTNMVGPTLADLLRKPADLDVATAATLATDLCTRTNENDPQAEYEVHKCLAFIYNQHVLPFWSPELVGTTNEVHLAVRNILERFWLQKLASRAQALLPIVIPDNAEEFVRQLTSLLAGHRAQNHPLFDYVRDDASKVELEEYFTWDAPLNVRFYDNLLLSMIGIEGDARQELIHNLLDETGRGDDLKAHTTLFRNLMAHIGRDDDPNAVLWRLPTAALAGYNLFMLMTLDRTRYFEMVGLMAITEQIDPPNYEKLMAGATRLNYPTNVLDYYSLHIVQEVEHGDGWNESLVKPALALHPDAGHRMIIGAIMRLETAADYYDAVLTRFGELRQQ